MMLSARLRDSIEDEIERLIAMLDALETDVDLEPVGDDEPILGWPDRLVGYGVARRFTGSNDDEREEVCEDEGAQCDDEGVEDSGIADPDALHSEEVGAGGKLTFDGSGAKRAKKQLRGKKRKRPQFVANCTEDLKLKPRGPSYLPCYELKDSDFDRLPWAE